MIRGSFKPATISGAIFLLATLFDAGGANAQAPAAAPPSVLQQIQADLAALRSQVEALRPRKFYLTPDLFDGAQAPAACAVGFHMASQYEILDPTSLRYDTTRGLTQGDSGSGPPSDQSGWIRTGNRAQTFPDVTDGNCNGYTSNSAGHYGTQVELSEHWETEAPTQITPFSSGFASCQAASFVWCVQD